jgi:hypothetical protein
LRQRFVQQSALPVLQGNYMHTNVNLEAPLAALALLATAFLILVAAIVLVQSLVVRKLRRAKVVMLALVAIVALYGSTVVAFSFASHYSLLARGQEKHFCELDCHLAYSIIRVAPAAASADGHQPVTVTIKTRFDETTISPARGNALLYPNQRTLTLYDDRGNLYAPQTQSGTSLTTPLHPGESYTTDVLFNLPPGVKPAKLLLNEGDWITHVVIGHENSPFHKKTEFQL